MLSQLTSGEHTFLAIASVALLLWSSAAANKMIRAANSALRGPQKHEEVAAAFAILGLGCIALIAAVMAIIITVHFEPIAIKLTMPR